MEEETIVFSGLTILVIVGLLILVAGVLEDAEHLNAFTASGSGLIVASVMLMAVYLDRMES